jgi:hypothetical protein
MRFLSILAVFITLGFSTTPAFAKCERQAAIYASKATGLATCNRQRNESSWGGQIVKTVYCKLPKSKRFANVHVLMDSQCNKVDAYELGF